MTNEVRYQYGRDFEYEFAQQPSTQYEQDNLLRSAGGTYTNPLGLPPQVFITNGFYVRHADVPATPALS